MCFTLMKVMKEFNKDQNSQTITVLYYKPTSSGMEIATGCLIWPAVKHEMPEGFYKKISPDSVIQKKDTISKICQHNILY